MEELRDIEAARDATVANLRRAFAEPCAEAPAAFGALLRRLAAQDAQARRGVGASVARQPTPSRPARSGATTET